MTHLTRLSNAIGFRTRIVGALAVVVLALASVAARRVGLPVPATTRVSQGGPALTKLPDGYRDWSLISVAAVGSPLSDLRAKLGNAVAMSAFRAGKIPFPDGTIIARLAWKQMTSQETNDALQRGVTGKLSPDAIQKLLAGSFVAGAPTNVQVMVKDSKRWASTGGWGFAQFTDGKPDTGVQAGERLPVLSTCFACHAPAKGHDFVFSTYAP
jgi:Cytochrome P460